MKASPIQWALCVTCLLLLLAKVWDWWQSLGQRGAPPWVPGSGPWSDDAAFPQGGTLQVGLPLSVVAPDIANAPSPAFLRAPTPLPPEPPPAPVPVHGPANEPEPEPAPVPTPAPVHVPVHVNVPEAAPEDPEPAPVYVFEPADPDPIDVPVNEPEPDPALCAHLADLAARELAAARLRAKSMLINAEEQVRAILEEAERMASAVTEQSAALPRPQGPDLTDSRRQGTREGHAIGLRKGELEALARIEQVFAQIESLLDAAPVSRTTSSGGLPGMRPAW